MGMIINVFARYAGVEGSKQSLTKGELKVLMEKELPGFLQVGAQGLGGMRGGLGSTPGQLEEKGGRGRPKGLPG